MGQAVCDLVVDPADFGKIVEVGLAHLAKEDAVGLHLVLGVPEPGNLQGDQLRVGIGEDRGSGQNLRRECVLQKEAIEAGQARVLGLLIQEGLRNRAQGDPRKPLSVVEGWSVDDGVELCGEAGSEVIEPLACFAGRPFQRGGQLSPDEISQGIGRLHEFCHQRRHVLEVPGTDRRGNDEGAGQRVNLLQYPQPALQCKVLRLVAGAVADEHVLGEQALVALASPHANMHGAGVLA